MSDDIIDMLNEEFDESIPDEVLHRSAPRLLPDIDALPSGRLINKSTFDDLTSEEE